MSLGLFLWEGERKEGGIIGGMVGKRVGVREAMGSKMGSFGRKIQPVTIQWEQNVRKEAGKNMAGKPKKKEKKLGNNNKYESHILPNLEQIEVWLRQGGTEKEIAEKLGIADSTYRLYLTKGREGDPRYSAISALYARVNAINDTAVEGALFRSTQGYNAVVRKPMKVKHVEYDEGTGKKIAEWDEIQYVEEEVHVAANVEAQKFWLVNRAKDRWKLKPDEQQEQIESQSGIALIPEVMADG